MFGAHRDREASLRKSLQIKPAFPRFMEIFLSFFRMHWDLELSQNNFLHFFERILPLNPSLPWK